MTVSPPARPLLTIIQHIDSRADAADVTSAAGTRPLHVSPEEFRRLGHALVDTVAEFLASARERPVNHDMSPREVPAALGAETPLPDDGTEPGALLESTAQLLFEHSFLNAHPRFFGYITSSPAPIGMLGELLAAAVNPNVGAWRLSPMASEIEAQTVR